MNAEHAWPSRWLRFARPAYILRRFFPEWLESGIWLTRPIPRGSLADSIRSNKQSAYRIFAFLRDQPPKDPKFAPPSIEVLLCYHSRANHSKQPILEIGERLFGRGISTVILSYEGVRFLSGAGEAKKDLEDQWVRLQGAPVSRVARFFLAARSFFSWMVLCGILPFIHWRLAAERIRGFFDSWEVLLQSRRRLDSASTILRHFGVQKILVTHERHHPGSEFLLCRKARHLKTYTYLHAPPQAFELPVLSQVAFGWDDAFARLVANFPHVNGPRVVACGNWEVELYRRGEYPIEPVWPPTVLFLSQQSADSDPEAARAGARALSWLREAADRIPELRFCIKTRHYEDPSEAWLRSIASSRLRLLPAEIDFGACLRNSGVRVVLAISSSGLWVASGMGKPALRLCVPGAPPWVPAVDEVATRIYSASQLVDRLKIIQESGPSLLKPTSPIADIVHHLISSP